VIAPIDLGICRGYEYEGDPARTAIVLPGAMLAGMPVNAYAIEGLSSRGWRAILVWDEFVDRMIEVQRSNLTMGNYYQAQNAKFASPK